MLALGMGVWRISISLAIILVLINVLAWYVGRRAAWALALPRWAQRLMGVLFVLGIVAAFVARSLGPDHAALAGPLGTFGGAVVLGIAISSVLLLPVELGRVLARAVRRLRASRASRTAAASAGSAFAEAPPSAEPQPARREFIAQVAAGSALSLGMGSAAYGTLFGRHDYTVETVPIKLAKLPRQLDGLTIVQLSDIHVGTFVGERELSAARALVRDAKADLVVLTGDLLDHDVHYAPVLARFARALGEHARFGVYAIPGNHDHYAGADSVLRHLRSAGTEVLLNRHVRIGGPDHAFVLAGLDDVAGPNFGSAGPQLARTFAGAPPDLARVLLSHNPAYFPTSHPHADLTLSGHTHGGQISLFINTAALVLRHGLVRGHYSVDGSQLYVNRGFGTAGPPARIGSPPEVTRLVLTV